MFRWWKASAWNFFDWWRLLPQYWTQNERTDREWDAELNRLLDEHEDTLRLDYMTVWFGDTEVWVGNWPYAYGHIWSRRMGSRSIAGNHPPTVSTRRRLRQAVRRAKERDSNASR